MLSEASARRPVARPTPAVAERNSASRRLRRFPGFAFMCSPCLQFLKPGSCAGVNGLCLVRTGRLGLDLPVVCAERAGGESGAIEECCDWIRLPGVADFLWVRHVGRGDDDRIALDASRGPVELLIVAGNGELAQLVAFANEATIGMGELEADLALATLHFLDRGTLVDDLLVTVDHHHGAAGDTIAGGFFVRGMDGVGIASVDGNGEAGVRNGLRDHGL